MRKVIEEQMQLGAVDISKIKFDIKSRDEIPSLLRGLQHIYCSDEIRLKVFALLEEHIKLSKTGRRGMDLWGILVIGVLRLNCNWDYDKLKEMVDNHKTIREMLGHTPFDDEHLYPLQTLKDNISLLTPDLLNAINTITVNAGHELVKKKDNKLHARCDSFVVETNVHYPTDINLLWDAIRKAITLTANLCDENDITGWRQVISQLYKFKALYRQCQKARKSTSNDEKKKAEKEKKTKQIHKDCIEKALELLNRALASMKEVLIANPDAEYKVRVIEMFISDGVHQIDLINRRVLNGEKIPHSDKIHSLFERYTEWICKGKAGISQELGKRVCIIEDQYGFVLHHEVMNKVGDKDMVVPFIKETKRLFPNLESSSFDKGYWSPENKEELQQIINVALPKKGRLSKNAAEYESSPEFTDAAKKHSAVESCINALENHGLDRCPDKGEKNFNCYISLAVLSRNIQQLGTVIIKKEKQKKKHSERIKAGLRQRQAELQLVA